jgi:thioredoxin reductase (NADPH)
VTARGFDVVVVGSGVGALTAATFAARHGLRTGVHADILLGGQVLDVEELSNFPGISSPMSGAELSAIIEAEAKAAGAEFFYERATSIRRENDKFVVESDLGSLTSGAVIVATGSTARHLNVPGEELFFGRGVSHCASCDGGFFEGEKVAVIGGGDSAADAALALANIAAEVTIIARETLDAMASTQKRVEANSRIRVRAHREPIAIEGDQTVSSLRLRDTLSGAEDNLQVTGVFVYAGLTPNTDLLAPLVPLESSGHVRTTLNMETSVAGLFAVGDIRADFCGYLVNAASDGVTAGTAAARYLNRERRITKAPIVA